MKAKRSSLPAAVFGMTLAAAGTPVAAQELAGAATWAEDIVVTARKREEGLQTVPISITAFESDVIERARIVTVADIAALTPGFSFTPLFGGGVGVPVIRGQSTTIGEPNVGFFIDGVYQSSRAIMDAILGDAIERVEVVKGPQSALYGRNTFAGAINFVTRTPGNEVEGGADISFASGNLVDVRANVSGPLVEDRLFARVGGRYVTRDGHFRNELTGGMLDSQESAVVTGALTFRPSAMFQSTLRLGYESTDDGDYPLRFAANNFSSVNPIAAPLPPAFQMFRGTLPEYREGFAVTPGFNKRQNLLISLSMEGDLGGGYTLTSITGYNHLNIDRETDNDYEARQIRFSFAESNHSEINQELRLTSPNGERFNWFAGVYYYSLDATSFIDDQYVGPAAALARQLSTTPLRGLLPLGNINETNETTENFAVFGQAIWSISDTVRLTAEGRWSTETKTAFATDTSPLTGARAQFSDTATFSFFTPRVTLDWRANDRIFLYATAGQGKKAGGFNVVTATGGILPEERTYDSESAWTYEAGVKTTFADGRVRLNLAAYYIDWRNQIVRAVGQTFAVLNANVGESTVKGLEADLSATLAEGVNISGGFAYTDSRYDDYNFAVLRGFGLDPILDGTVLQYVPKYQANASLDVARPISDRVGLLARADLSYQSELSAVQTADAVSGDFVRLNLRAGFEIGSFSLTGWVENLLDDRAAVSGVFVTNFASRFDTADRLVAGRPIGFQAFGGLVTARTPQTFGLTARYRF